MHRRAFLTGALGFLAAPAIVRVGSLMPVSVLPVETRGILPLPYKEVPHGLVELLHQVHLRSSYFADLFDNRALMGTLK